MLEGLDVEPAPPDPEVPGPLRTVHEDHSLIVVDKPAGLPCAPGRFRDRDSVLSRLALPDAQVLHELDPEARGLVVVPKTAAVAVALHRHFSRGELVVTYEATLQSPVSGAGVIDLPLRLDRDHRPLRIIDDRGKRAVTEWTALSPSRVLLVPRTDRTHQLRVHTAHALSPIVGDELYGTPHVGLQLRCITIAFPSHTVTL
jgi:tRNA pseudouridine32 synthase/23S rRNA pseudouridine746 synthase